MEGAHASIRTHGALFRRPISQNERITLVAASDASFVLSATTVHELILLSTIYKAKDCTIRFRRKKGEERREEEKEEGEANPKPNFGDGRWPNFISLPHFLRLLFCKSKSQIHLSCGT
jgi:hypothetical protein